MTMLLALIELRLTAYVAVTTASVQVGAAVELNASVVGCGLRGSFSFDALIDWKPQFHFLVDVRIALAVEAFGETLCGVAFSGSLSGPGPWHLHGSGEIEVLWFTVQLPIDATFGSAPPAPPPLALDVAQLLTNELQRPQSWSILPPAAVDDGVTLTDVARADLAAARVIHPGGGIQVTEHLLPLDIPIQRFSGRDVPGSPVFSINTVCYGDGPGSRPAAVLNDEFADGAFETLTVEQQLAVNGFTSHHSGVQIVTTGLLGSTVVPHATTPWDDIIVNPDTAPTGMHGTPTNTLWPLANLADLVPQREPAVTKTIAGDPIRLVPQMSALEEPV